MEADLNRRRLQNHRYNQDREPKQPDKYASAIASHSKKSSTYSLYPGTNYKRLSDFLNTKSGGSSSVTTHGTLQQKFAYVIIHDLAFELCDPRRVTEFDSEHGLKDFVAFQLPHDGCGQLIFLRGWPSPPWINSIGAKYRVDPEILRRHLPLGHDQDLFEIPGPPSSSANTVRLKIMTLGKLEGATIERNGAKAALQAQLRALSNELSATGQSIVRQFCVHDEDHFSMEQEVSISVLRRGNGWIGLVLLDNGKALLNSPFLKELQRSRKLSPVFYPTIQFDARMCFSYNNLNSQANGSHYSPLLEQRHAQSAALLPTRLYGEYLSTAAMRQDAFYAVHGLFAFSACSESQFLNCLRTKLDAKEESLLDHGDVQKDLRDVVYHKSLVRDHKDYLKAVLSFIQNGGGPRWTTTSACTAQHPNKPIYPAVRVEGSPSLSPVQCPSQGFDTTHSMPEASAAKDALIKDYEALFQKACGLLQMYNERLEDMRTAAVLHEAREATGQAKFMSRLSFLVFLFVPLSFTTSAFGMNVRELDDPPAIWYWIAISFPVFVCSLVIFFWAQVRSATRGFCRFVTSCRHF